MSLIQPGPNIINGLLAIDRKNTKQNNTMRTLMRHKLILFICLSVALFFGLAGCAQQAANPNLANKLNILEKRIIVLEQQELKTLADLREDVELFKKKAHQELETFRKSQQFFIEELNRLKSDMEISTNDNELNQSRIRKNASKLDNLNKRLGDQIIALQELQKFFKSGIDLDSETPQKERADFNTAFQLYKTRSFKKAEQEFLNYRKDHPNSDLADDSLYFIGYIYFLQGNYNTASLRFFELIKQYPDSNRLNDTKWWLGVSLERSGDLNGALDIYKELTKLESNDPLRIKAEFRLEELAP